MSKLSIKGLKRLIDEVITEETHRSPSKKSRRPHRVTHRIGLANYLFEGEEEDPITKGAEAAAGKEEPAGDFAEALAVLKGEGGGEPLSAALAGGATAAKGWIQKYGKTPNLMKLLGMGTQDGADEEMISAAGPKGVPVSDISATQNFISIHGSVGWPLSVSDSFAWWAPSGGSSAGFTDNRNQPAVCANSSAGVVVLDGHHRWSAGLCMGGSGFSLQAMVFNFPAEYQDPQAELAVSHIAIATVVGDGTTPAAEGVGGEGANILGQDIDKMLKNLLGQNNPDNGKVYGSDEWFAAVTGGDAGALEAAKNFGVTDDMLPAEGEEITDEQKKTIWDAICTKIAGNWGGGKETGGPGRADMPQFGGGDTHSVDDSEVFKKMSAGEINFMDPYEPQKGSKKESVRTRNSGKLIVERWSRLAGIDKK